MTKKQPIAQSELFKTDTTWFHMFKEIIRNGTWARLSSNSKSLYPVIKAYINWESGAAFPSIDTLEQYSGISRPSVIKALKELEVEGLLIKQTTAGRHSNYTLVEKFDVKDGEGRPAASVSFDYLPSYISDSVAELKNYIAQGLIAPDGKTNFIKIDTLNINIANGGGSNITNNIRAGMDEATLMQGIKDMAANKKTPQAQLVSAMVEGYEKEIEK
jgi:biotin operon repressor